MATRYVTLKDSNGDTIYPQSVISQVANGEITTGLLADGAVTAPKLDFSDMYLAAPALSDNVNVGTRPVIQTLTLPAGKWRVFAQLRLSVANIGANTTRLYYFGLFVGSSTVAMEVPANVSGDTEGSGRQWASYSYELTTSSSTQVKSFVTYSSTGSASVTSSSYPALFAIRIG